jgi:hypothetical protein
LAFAQQSPLQTKESADGQHCPASLHWPEQQPSTEQQFWASSQHSLALQTKLPSDGQQIYGASTSWMHCPAQHSPSQQESAFGQQLSPQGKFPAAQQTPVVVLHCPGSQQLALSPLPQQVLAFGQHSPLQTNPVSAGQQAPSESQCPSQQPSALQQFWASVQHSLALQTKLPSEGQQTSNSASRMHWPAQHSPSQQVSALAQQVSSQAN